MPETPDFESIARGIFVPERFWNRGADVTITPEFAEELRLRIAEQLRLVWNARGAADIAKVDAEIFLTYKNLDQAIRSLDR